MVVNSKNVLIIEDDDLIAQMYKASLQNANFSVQVAIDGETGWTMMQTAVPDVVLLDFMLPKLNGIEILQKMRTDPKLQHVPVIMVSSLASDADKKRALDAGANYYWVKNEIDMVNFGTKINEVMSSSTK